MIADATEAVTNLAKLFSAFKAVVALMEDVGAKAEVLEIAKRVTTEESFIVKLMCVRKILYWNVMCCYDAIDVLF